MKKLSFLLTVILLILCVTGCDQQHTAETTPTAAATNAVTSMPTSAPTDEVTPSLTPEDTPRSTSIPTPTDDPTAQTTPAGRTMYTIYSCFYPDIKDINDRTKKETLLVATKVTAFETVQGFVELLQDYDNFTRVQMPDGRYGYIRTALLYDSKPTPTPKPTPEPKPTIAPQSSMIVSGSVFIGKYEQDNDLTNGPEPIVWQVLEVKDGQALVYCPAALDIVPYNETNTDVTWETCSLRAWLNDTFLKKTFTAEEQKQIVTTKISAATELFEGTKFGNDTEDKIFILSIEEQRYYRLDRNTGMFSRYAINRVKATGAEKCYSYTWLRGPGMYQNHARYVIASGIDCSSFQVDYNRAGVCPAMWVSLPPDPPRTGTPRPTLPPADQVKAGDTVYLGYYEQDMDRSNGNEDMAWDVLEVKDGKALVISHYVLDSKYYKFVSEQAEPDFAWETSEVRYWLNGTFLKSSFMKEERERILLTVVSDDRNQYDTIDPGDKIFLLSLPEIEKYFPDSQSRCIAPTAYAIERCFFSSGYAPLRKATSCCWWLRSPGKTSPYAAFVNKDGSFEYNSDSTNLSIGIRPAMWIRLD